MNTRILDPWIAIPAAIAYCGLGIAVSGAVFNKLSHLVEYTLNKSYGDYKNPKKTLNGKVIVSMPKLKDYYNVQNIALICAATAISSKAMQVLVLNHCPTIAVIPFLIGSVIGPVLFGLLNMISYNTGGYHSRWVEISDAEINKHGINKYNVEAIDWSVRVYCGFGTAPKSFPGQNTVYD